MAHADEAFRVWYAEIERQFPLLPDAMFVAADTTGWGLAWYLGFRNGLPTFAVNATFTLNFKVAAHEVGHAYEDYLWMFLYPKIGDPRAAYWRARGFPGTWEEAQAKYIALRDSGGDPFAVWKLIPGESWAECFAAVVTGIATDEWTENYGLPIDLTKMRAFFESFGKEEDVDRVTFDAWFEENLAKYRHALQEQLQRTAYDPLDIVATRVTALEQQPPAHEHSGTVTVK